MGKLKLRPAVRRFASEMERWLRVNEWKGGWQDCDFVELESSLDYEVDELKRAILAARRGGPMADIVREAADVANFAMMIADNAAAKGDQ